MSKEIISSNEIKPIGNPDQYFMNRDMLRGFCKEFLNNFSFVQHLWLLCSSKRDLHHSEDVRLLSNLNQQFPNIKKFKVYTRRFGSSVNDILCSFSSFENLEDFDIVFDSVSIKNQLKNGFKSLKKLSITN